jgi:hypothetical protein
MVVEHVHSTTDEHVIHLIHRSRGDISVEERQAILHELIERYHELPDKEAPVARELRQAFLLTLEDHPTVLEQEKLAHFLVEHISADDFADLLWETPDHVVTFSETIYGFQGLSDTMSQQVTAHVHALLCHALHQFERQGDYENMFRLLQIAPISPASISPELHRLRNRVYRYEMQRVRRRRYLLYGYLLLQVILIGIVFPYLFIYAENGLMQSKIEEMANVDLPQDVNRQYFTFADGLYWSLITAGSIGYGDITPVTQMGRIIAATLGIMGVITIGVIAGLILNWITPRRLDWY